MTIELANITIPAPLPYPTTPADRKLTSEELASLFERLQALDRKCGANKHDRVTTLIQACITEEINTRPKILGVLGKMGFNKGHVALILTDGTGKDPSRHWWQRNDVGTYSNLG